MKRALSRTGKAGEAYRILAGNPATKSLFEDWEENVNVIVG
jgi:hypothetical protein